MALSRPNQSMLGSATVFLDMLEQVSSAAPLNRPVLVIGERGTGKELISARLHYLSPRWEKPLLTLKCAALGESLLEAELFGHEAGAFTGATRRREGFFERADGGTLFLDEIGSASMAVQEKILRVVEYGEFQRLGGQYDDQGRCPPCRRHQCRPADRGGEWQVPRRPAGPSRLRRGDRPAAARTARRHPPAGPQFRSGDGTGDQAVGVSRLYPRAERILETYSWPGNVRELKNVVERAVYRAANTDQPIDTIVLDPFDSPFRPRNTPLRPANSAVAATPTPLITETASPSAPPQPYDFFAHIATIEQEALKIALASCGGNQKRTAAHLGLAYHQLRNLLRKHGMFGHTTANSPQNDETIEDDDQND